MEVLSIEGTKITPTVLFDKSKGIISLSGLSRPEDGVKFYQPLMDWMKRYVEEPNPSSIFTLKLEYFNTSSSKMVFSLISLLKNIQAKGLEVTVEWHYLEYDEDLLEMGQDYASIVPIPFKYIPCKE